MLHGYPLTRIMYVFYVCTIPTIEIVTSSLREHNRVSFQMFYMCLFNLQFVVPESVGPRLWHRVVCYKYSNRLRQLLFFGGCPGIPEDATASWAKLASTALMEIGKILGVCQAVC